MTGFRRFLELTARRLVAGCRTDSISTAVVSRYQLHLFSSVQLLAIAMPFYALYLQLKIIAGYGDGSIRSRGLSYLDATEETSSSDNSKAIHLCTTLSSAPKFLRLCIGRVGAGHAWPVRGCDRVKRINKVEPSGSGSVPSPQCDKTRPINTVLDESGRRLSAGCTWMIGTTPSPHGSPVPTRDGDKDREIRPPPRYIICLRERCPLDLAIIHQENPST